ncbi:MAG: hypothetical protein RBQ71_07375 [Acholeplasmataceae bacterium]|jgi:hypothetical protein|nr:hypothetical protein [Acholeplasmataceae bacterium]
MRIPPTVYRSTSESIYGLLRYDTRIVSDRIILAEIAWKVGRSFGMDKAMVFTVFLFVSTLLAVIFIAFI